MEFLAKCTLAEATRQYQSDAKYLKSRKGIIRICAELLELEPHGQQASMYRRKKQNAEDEYLITQRFSSLLKRRMKQLRGPAHKIKTCRNNRQLSGQKHSKRLSGQWRKPISGHWRKPTSGQPPNPFVIIDLTRRSEERQ